MNEKKMYYKIYLKISMAKNVSINMKGDDCGLLVS